MTKYIGNIPELNIVHTWADRYDYVMASNPAVDTNPSIPYATWLNTITGEVWTCLSNGVGLNRWSGSFKSVVYPYTLPIHTVGFSFDSPSTAPYGLTFDGTNLISCDYNARKIYVHDGVSSTILTSFDSPSTSPRGLTFDGTNLISCDSTADKIYVHKRAD